MQHHPDIESIMISEEQIRNRICSLAEELKKDYADKNPLVVAILKGSVMFYADLTRMLDFPIKMEFISVSSYGNNSTSGELHFQKDLDIPIDGRHVLLVEDIIDSGKTLYVLKNHLSARNPASIKICAFLDKKARRAADIEADYVGFPCKDEFVVGYGLDYAEKYRNLPYIGILKRSIYEQ